MILVKAKRDEILVPLSAVSGIIERRHTLPILSNVLIERVGGNALVPRHRHRDPDHRAAAASTAAAERARITVGARKLLDILRALPDDGRGDPAAAGQAAAWSRPGKSRFTLQTLAGRGLPAARQAGRRGGALQARRRRRCARLLSLVQFAMAQQDIRYYLNGLLLVVEERQPASSSPPTATGSRSPRIKLGGGPAAPGSDPAAQDRARALEAARRQRRRGDASSFPPTRRASASATIELVSKLVDGKFPDYTRVIPTGHKNRLQIEREPLRQALQRAAILSNEKFRGVRWVLADGSLKIVSTNTEQEEAEEELEVEVHRRRARHRLQRQLPARRPEQRPGGRGRVRVRRLHLERARSRMPSEKDFKYVVMPMRI